MARRNKGAARAGGAARPGTGPAATARTHRRHRREIAVKPPLLTSLALPPGSSAAATAWRRLDTGDLATALDRVAAVAMQRIRI